MQAKAILREININIIRNLDITKLLVNTLAILIDSIVRAVAFKHLYSGNVKISVCND